MFLWLVEDAEFEELKTNEYNSEESEMQENGDESWNAPTYRNSENTNLFNYETFGLLEIVENPQGFALEISMVMFLVIYIANFFVGKNKNNYIAGRWFDSIFPELQNQFYAIGAYDPPSTDKLIKESHNVFKVYASGRRYCSGFLANLEVIYLVYLMPSFSSSEFNS